MKSILYSKSLKVIVCLCVCSLILTVSIWGHRCYMESKDYLADLDAAYQRMDASMKNMEEVVFLVEPYLQPEDRSSDIINVMNMHDEIAIKVQHQQDWYAIVETRNAIDKVMFRQCPAWIDAKIPEYFAALVRCYQLSYSRLFPSPAGTGEVMPYPVENPKTTTVFGMAFSKSKENFYQYWGGIQGLL